MLLSYILAIILSAIPSATSFPTEFAVVAGNAPFNCGYVLFRRNENSHVSLSALDSCKYIFFNTTSQTYTEAYAYHIYGGCGCKFFEYVTSSLEKEAGVYLLQSCRTEISCQIDIDPPVFTGPTNDDIGKAVDFVDPKPKWYNCALQQPIRLSH